MAIRKILQENDSLLRKKSREVENIDEKIITLLDDMAETLKKAEGLGLAAPQVGILRRIAIIDTPDGVIELINPRIVKTTGEQYEEEGCLSVEGVRGKVVRPKKVITEAYNRAGDLMKYTAEGILAVAFCHEIDHLDGILFIDKVKEFVYD